MSTSCPLRVPLVSISQPKCTHSPTPRSIRNNSRFGGPRPTPQALASPLTPNRVHASVSILALFTFALASNTRIAAGVPHFTRQILTALAVARVRNQRSHIHASTPADCSPANRQFRPNTGKMRPRSFDSAVLQRSGPTTSRFQQVPAECP